MGEQPDAYRHVQSPVRFAARARARRLRSHERASLALCNTDASWYRRARAARSLLPRATYATSSLLAPRASRLSMHTHAPSVHA